MEVLFTQEEMVDGIIYIVTAFEDGHIEKSIKEGQEDIIPTSQLESIEMQTNIEYLVALAEMNMEV